MAFSFVLACSGFCAMAFEVLWSRALVFSSQPRHTHSPLFSAWCSWGWRAEDWSRRSLQKKHDIPPHGLATLQLFIGIYGFASLFILPGLYSVIHFNEGQVTHVWRYWIGVSVCFLLFSNFPGCALYGGHFSRLSSARLSGQPTSPAAPLAH